MKNHRPLGAALAAIATMSAWNAHAQNATGFGIDRYRPTPVGDAFFAVSGANTTGWLTPRAALGLDYALDPLVLQTVCAAEPCAPLPGEGSIVGHQLQLHASGSLALFDRILVSVDVPAALVNEGDDDAAVTAPSGAAMGDIRAGLRGRLFGEARDPFQIALGGYVWFPSGDRDAFAGEGRVRGMPQLSLSGLVPLSDGGPAFVWSAEGGVLVREARRVVTDVALGSELTFGVAAGVLLLDETLQLGPELYGATAMVGDDPFARGNTNLELLIGGRYRFLDDFQVGLAAGPGLTEGVGTPAFRGVFMLSYSPPAEREEPLPPEPVDQDGDGDGIWDRQDACPEVPGVASADPSKHGCPPPGDRDGDGILDPQDACVDVPGVQSPDPARNGCPADSDEDGILDLEDACPTVPGAPSEDPKQNGCPPDRDGDTIFDAEDACPDRPGVRSDDPTKNGCPVDTDGDGIMNDVDACPLESGPPNDDPAKNGCPTLVRVTDDKIEILQQPRFAFDRAAIMPESAELLGQVAQVLREHPEITKVRIEGHTDDRGPDAYNKRLSEQRAQAVRDWLIKVGIDGARLVAVGHGEERPVVANDSEDNRAKNRRVEFHIMERTAPPAEGGSP